MCDSETRNRFDALDALLTENGTRLDELSHGVSTAQSHANDAREAAEDCRAKLTEHMIDAARPWMTLFQKWMIGVSILGAVLYLTDMHSMASQTVKELSGHITRDMQAHNDNADDIEAVKYRVRTLEIGK